MPQELGVGVGRGRWGLPARPGAVGEVPGWGWYPHLSWGDRADIFSTCGQRVRGWRSPAAGGDPVTGGAKHQRAGNSKASLVGPPSLCSPGAACPCRPPQLGHWVTAPGVGPLPPMGASGCGVPRRGPWGGGAGAWPAAGGGQRGRRLLFIIVKMWAAAVGPAGRQHMIPAAWG